MRVIESPKRVYERLEKNKTSENDKKL